MFNCLKSRYLLLPAWSLVMLTGCNDSNNNQGTEPVVQVPVPVVEVSYQVTVTNLTYGQPFSPLGLVLHDRGSMWNIGESVTPALEMLAESGDNTEFMAQSQVLAMASNDQVLLPGSQTSITITTTNDMARHFTLATMLVNTNDGFSGVTGLDLSAMAVAQSKTKMLGVYDAGTEMNSELAGTVPGPSDGGIGFDVQRDDVDYLAMHPGVVSSDDGLSTSVLKQQHRFDGPVLQLTLTRIK
jgi:hypothetical protein